MYLQEPCKHMVLIGQARSKLSALGTCFLLSTYTQHKHSAMSIGATKTVDSALPCKILEANIAVQSSPIYRWLYQGLCHHQHVVSQKRNWAQK